MDKQCNLKIKHFSALHLFLVPMLICGFFGVNFNLFTSRDLFLGGSWLGTIIHIGVTIGLILCILATRIISICTVFDKENKTINSHRYTIFGKYSSKINFSDVIKIEIRSFYWGRYRNERRDSLFICIQDDEIPILESKKYPPGCDEEEKEIREFIELLEDSSEVKKDSIEQNFN